MAHEFTPDEREPEAEAAGSRYGGPPRRYTAAGVLDPPVPPKKPIPPTPAIPRPVIKWLAAAILLGLALSALMMFLK